jgi:hypothetical protein
MLYVCISNYDTNINVIDKIMTTSISLMKEQFLITHR